MARFNRRVNVADEEFLPPELSRLIDDPTPILNVIGMHLAEESRDAWKRREYGGIRWPEQYPGMSDFIHIAGAIEDLRKGPSIHEKRFERQDPQLVDSGNLRNSIHHQIVSKNVVEAGVVKRSVSYAGAHNTGVDNSPPQAITGTIRRNLFTVMRRTKRDKSGKGGKIKKLGFLFSVDEYQQSIAQRPFIGITDRARKTIPLIVRSILEGKPIEQVQ